MLTEQSAQEIQDSLTQKGNIKLSTDNSGAGRFNILPISDCNTSVSHYRRDFYEIVLIIGKGILKIADEEILIDQPTLGFITPSMYFTWETTSEELTGWCCLFSEEFICSQSNINGFQNNFLSCFEISPIYFPTGESLNDIIRLFEDMASEMASDYIYKYQILLNYLHLLIHKGLKIYPTTNLGSEHLNASQRITFQFLELLGKQFPIRSPQNPLILKSPQDFAKKLFIHVNHLNHSLKSYTGKTSTQHISARMLQEAKAMLQYSDWTISEIAYTLGFEYSAHFSNFFKKGTGLAPKKFREEIL